jgi:hypothetical protein
MTNNTDSEVLKYILTVFPQELELLDELAEILRERNGVLHDRNPVDVEPVLVASLWMRRVLQHARRGQLDLKGVFHLSACLSTAMPKVQAIREAELRGESPAEIEK